MVKDYYVSLHRVKGASPDLAPVANGGFAPLCGAAATPVAALKTPVAKGEPRTTRNHIQPIHLLISPDIGAKVRTSHLTYVSTTYYLFSVHSVYSVASVPEGDYYLLTLKL